MMKVLCQHYTTPKKPCLPKQTQGLKYTVLCKAFGGT